MGKIVTERYFCDICRKEVKVNQNNYNPGLFYNDLVIPDFYYSNKELPNESKALVLSNYGIVCEKCAEKIAKFVETIKKDAVVIEFNV